MKKSQTIKNLEYYYLELLKDGKKTLNDLYKRYAEKERNNSGKNRTPKD